MRVYETPGVYFERVEGGGAAVPALRTDIAGFVGIAPRGPIHTAVPIQSFRQFQSYFGEFTATAYLAYAVRGFFENGGRRCWVVRVVSDLATPASIELRGPGGEPIWNLEAFSPGVWGNELEITVRETHLAQTVTRRNDPWGEFSEVANIAGFDRNTLVRLSQDNSATVLKVVSDLDARQNRLMWVNATAERRLPWDIALQGFDPLRSILIESVEYTLLVTEERRLIRVYEGLSLIPDHPRYGPGVLGPVSIQKAEDQRVTVASAPEPIVLRERRDATFINTFLLTVSPPEFTDNLRGGNDGLTMLRSDDFIGEEIGPSDSDAARIRKLRGLRLLETVDEVAMLAVPDIHVRPAPVRDPAQPRLREADPCLPCASSVPEAVPVSIPAEMPPAFSEEDVFRVQSAVIEQCERRKDRIGILDAPWKTVTDATLGFSAIQSWRSRFESKYAALYYPWLRVVDPFRLAHELTRDLPPCGHVAGQYAGTDLRIGVHKAPANDPLMWVQDVTATVEDEVHGVLNSAGINVIRPFPSRGLRVVGACTLSSDPDWRFVNVRRLMMMVEKAVEISLQWSAFEPNHALTRAKLRLAISSFLLALWQSGALAGASADQAFFVRCDEENNPPSERENGRLHALVGVAPSQPLEFVVLRIGRTDNAYEVTELSGNLSMAGGT